MSQPVPRDILLKVSRLAQLPEEARQSRFAVSTTRLTVLKSLCQEPEVANRFVTYLAQRTRQKVAEMAGRPGSLQQPEWARHRDLIDRAVAAMERYVAHRSKEGGSQLWALRHELTGEQNEHRRIHGASVRLIRNNDLLLVEYALSCVLADAARAPQWAYQTARLYAERYDSNHGTGLIPASAPLLQDIADFWIAFFGVDRSAPPAQPARGTKAKEPRSRTRAGSQKKAGRPAFTPRQGQFLAFIHAYRKLHRQGPEELDLVKFFRLTPPSVHSMVVKLEELGLITRQPGVARSARVAIPEAEIPALEDSEGPPW